MSAPAAGQKVEQAPPRRVVPHPVAPSGATRPLPFGRGGARIFAFGHDRERPRSPRGAGGLVRARVRADVHGKEKEGRRPAWGGAEPDLPRGALGPWPRDFGGPNRCRSKAALSASARTRLAPGRARPPPGCRAARLVAPETGRRRTLRHRLARTGSAPHQPQPASRPKPPPRASRTRLLRARPIIPQRCRPTSRRLMSAPLCRAG